MAKKGSNVGIGSSSPAVPLEIVKVAGVSSAESILRMSVSDAPGDYLLISNASTVNNNFISSIYGNRVADNRIALVISSQYHLER